MDERTAPTDDVALDAWEQIMELARANGLVVQAYGGVATLAVPSEQREQGIRERVLRMHQMEENPQEAA